MGQRHYTQHTTGNYNTASGYEALKSNTTGSYNTAIGNGADVGSGNLTNATAIGNGTRVTESNTMALGNSALNRVLAGDQVLDIDYVLTNPGSAHRQRDRQCLWKCHKFLRLSRGRRDWHPRLDRDFGIHGDRKAPDGLCLGAGTLSASDSILTAINKLNGNDALKADLNNPTFAGTVSGIDKWMVGLGNVSNTSDAEKPVSTAQQAALNLKAPLASPTFTGTVGGINKLMVGLGNVNNTRMRISRFRLSSKRPWPTK